MEAAVITPFERWVAKSFADASEEGIGGFATCFHLRDYAIRVIIYALCVKPRRL